MIILRKNPLIHVLITILLFGPSYTMAAIYTVNNYTDLVNAINSINTNPGTLPDASNNQINITVASIPVSADLPVLQNGATITSTVGGTTIDGGSARNLFATFKASLALTNITLANGVAMGGNGASGGGR